MNLPFGKDIKVIKIQLIIYKLIKIFLLYSDPALSLPLYSSCIHVFMDILLYKFK